VKQMAQFTNSALSIDERDLLILQHVARHRLTTHAVLHRLFFSELQPNAVAKITSRLCRDKLLQKFHLIHPQVYFTLTGKACRLLGRVSARSLPLGPQSLPSEFAALHYCVCGPRYHKRLSKHEIRKQFPWFPKPTSHEIYSMDSQDSTGFVMEWIRADLGGPSHHIVRKTHRRLQSLTDSASSAEALKHGAFRVVLLTSTPEKAHSIQEALAPHGWPDGTLLHLAVIPQLVPLTSRYNHGT